MCLQVWFAKAANTENPIVFLSRDTTMFELVHLDLMGPTRTPSCSGYHYVMVIVDDFSRYTRVYFLKEKGEAMSKFIEFKTAVEKEFSMKVKCLCSDNGGEYMSNDFLKYYDDNNITRQMTCPDTLQQNRVAKRKLHHLAAMSLSWLHDKNLPRELWAEVGRCACHVIHRLPTWPGTEFIWQKTPLSLVTLFTTISMKDSVNITPNQMQFLLEGYEIED
ncbi:hypothetical protein RJ639_035716 [Escallonia herrerae]|uniref:Integrase catalytic domain-containing protein n=1 Tax=Escallonia herrerae TaxID=1293975 RepID=A0AA88WRN0_9ASTE|nr:hypothetical protein RJ639_035716 [Escallonia herrerae]